MDGDEIEPVQPQVVDGDDGPPVVGDVDAEGSDEADDDEEEAPAPKTDVPTESDADEEGGA